MAKYYNESAKKSALKYQKEKLKRLYIWMQHDAYDALALAADAAGEPVAAFVKKAIADRIEREGLASKNRKYYIRTKGYDMVATYDGGIAKWIIVAPEDDPAQFLAQEFDTTGWEQEEVEDFDEFFGIGNGAEILAKSAY